MRAGHSGGLCPPFSVPSVAPSRVRSMYCDEFEGPDAVEARVPTDDSYRTRSECSGDCNPDPSTGADDSGLRIAFVCPEHGVHNVIDPFEVKR